MHYVNQFLASIELYVDGAELSLGLYLSEATAIVSTDGTDREIKLRGKVTPTEVTGINRASLQPHLPKETIHSRYGMN